MVRAKKSALRLLNATVPAVPQYVKWSEKACTFDRTDHRTIIPKECYALVVSPCIDGYNFSKCLMDGGASLNIMYLETLERMNLTKEQLKHNTTEFHGVVPCKKANSLDSIKLPVAFGDVNNYCEEMITFEVVPFKSSYHVIFGRPTYHNFHARACSIYNKLKIPGPNGATYQRTMQRCLKDQIGRNVNAYVGDIAVMTRKGSDLISDLTETFENLRRYKMMLNPLKCVFGIPAGKLLGFIVSHRGIEVNPEKIKAILSIKRPTCLKDVQRLTGCVAAISRFVRRLGEKALPLHKLLKKTDKFVWDDAADATLQGLKDILSSPPILASPNGIEILREIHAGDCGHHAAPRSLVAKAFRLGFYWLTAKEDAEKLVKTCRGCQYYATQSNAPAQELKTIPITWPFAVWGLDMVGKLKKSSPGGHEYLMVVIDKFSKWIEAKPSTGFTPFFLVYGSKAVRPYDIIHDSPRVSAYDEKLLMRLDDIVDLIEEARNLATNAPPFSRNSDAITVVEFGKPLVHGRRLSPPPSSGERSQVANSMGRTLRHQQSASQRIILPC
ncbi:hypothetical protein QYE76_042533 [Lolium multiflorum]|uniref:Uncharacterized protein n=1 Tax=Lolium multiflorum TaxID=4521 RepID=A0AAD8TFI6_LOLMU|nr:hypothetical protein QYE76_042533 [Lolium multiflorum]